MKLKRGQKIIFSANNQCVYAHDMNFHRGIPSGIVFDVIAAEGAIVLSASGYGGTPYGQGKIMTYQGKIDGFYSVVDSCQIMESKG
jgi:hypothetical protein